MIGRYVLQPIREFLYAFLKWTAPRVNRRAGEWRCDCPPDPMFDTSINPSFVSACARCGVRRPPR